MIVYSHNNLRTIFFRMAVGVLGLRTCRSQPLLLATLSTRWESLHPLQSKYNPGHEGPMKAHFR